MFLRFIPVVMCSCRSFIFLAVFYYLNIPQFIILIIVGYLGCLWFLAIINSDVMDILAHVSWAHRHTFLLVVYLGVEL